MSSKFDRVDSVTHEEATEQFIERLGTLSLVDWLSVAASVTQTDGEQSEANAALERIVAQHGLAVDAWNISDDVETAFHYGVGANGHIPSPRDCLSLCVAREAATNAALALFVRPLLTPEDFESLCRPFASLVPATRWRRPKGSESFEIRRLNTTTNAEYVASASRRHGTR